MAFFKNLINFGNKALKENSTSLRRSKYYVDPNSIVVDNYGKMFCFNKLVIDGEKGFKKSEIVFYGKEDENSNPAYYLKSNGNKATLTDLIGVDSGIWISASALNCSPFLSENEKDPKLDSKSTIKRLIEAFQDLKNLTDITLEEYTKLRREIFEYLNPNITKSKCEKVEKLINNGQTDLFPRIILNQFSKKYEVLYVPKGLTKESYEKQYYEKLQIEHERKKAKEMGGYVLAGTTFDDSVVVNPKTNMAPASKPAQKSIEILRNF